MPCLRMRDLTEGPRRRCPRRRPTPAWARYHCLGTTIIFAQITSSIHPVSRDVLQDTTQHPSTRPASPHYW